MINNKKAYEIRESERGFTLAELAIVLVIIGIIISGILKGQELIEAARIRSVADQVQSILVATQTFLDRYDSLPGDFNKAKEVFGLENGNGDGILEGEGLEAKKEPVLFWAHLFSAGLIPDPGSASSTKATFGQGVPSSKLGGGFTVENDPAFELKGPWLILGQVNGNGGQGPLLTPHQAMLLCKKLGNGDLPPKVGRIRVFKGKGSAAECTKNDAWDITVNSPACTVYIQLLQ